MPSQPNCLKMCHRLQSDLHRMTLLVGRKHYRRLPLEGASKMETLVTKLAGSDFGGRAR